jgi:hypothetical protein
VEVATVRTMKRLVEVAIDARRRSLYGAARSLIARVPGTGARRLEYDWLMVPRSEYAWGLAQAAALARTLGIPGFTAIEFGVGAGGGLMIMEQHASWVSAETGVRIEVVGFDRGLGLPRPEDHRDVGYRWTEGEFKMDEAALRRQLRNAELVIGDIEDTAATYTPRLPIGFVAFDMDFYSSTMSALRVFEGEEWDRWLPRVSAYFDDLRTIEWVGERQAISDWNEKQEDRRVGQVLGLRDTLFAGPPWGDKMFQIHLFRHPRYEQPAPD